MLRPHHGIASARIIDIRPRPDGYAVLTSAGVDLFDETLAKRTTVASEAVGAFVELVDGRFVVYSSSLEVSAGGRPFEKLDTGGFLRDLVVTPHGFLAIGHGVLIVDHGGTRSVVEIADERLNAGGVEWNDGAAIAGREGLTLVDATGAEVARSENVWLTEKPIVVGPWIVVKGTGGTYVFDAQAREVYRTDRGLYEITAFSGGLLYAEADVDTGSDIGYWDFDARGQATERWRIAMPQLWNIRVAGAHAVVASEDEIAILDREGNVVETLAREGYLRGAMPFGGGIVLQMDQLVWWRAGEELQTLEHDVSPDNARAVPVGIASSEDDVLYLWRTDVQGPEATTFTTDLPFGIPIVVDGSLVTIESAAQFSLRARTRHGRTIALRPKGAWRHATTRDEAVRICERLVGRVFDGALPDVPSDGTHHRTLAQLPLAETVDLFGRSWFAPTTLDEAIRSHVADARDTFLAELAAALGTPTRVLLAALRARKLQLEPPRPVTGYDYLGTFTSSKTVIVADPVYVGKATLPSAMGFQLALKLNNAAEGLWHVFLRTVKDDQQHDRTAELVVVHERGFDVYASEEIGQIGVDGGCAGVFDKTCPKRDPDQPLEEGVVFGLGAVAWSGYGDGGYPVFAGTHAGEIVKIRLPFIDDAPEIDRLVAKSTNAKPYSASATFAPGDTIEHVKFGTGSVIRAGGDGKIDVRFPDGTRTLVHARKK